MLDELLRYVPAPHHAAYLGLLSHVPNHAREIGVVGESCAALGYLLKRRPGTRVTGLTEHPKSAAIAREILDRVADSPAAVNAEPTAHLDAIILCNLESGVKRAVAWLEGLAPALHSHTLVYALFGNPAEGGLDSFSDAAALGMDLERQLTAAGYVLYRHWDVDGHGNGRLLLAVAKGYDPVHHARTCCSAGDFEGAYQILEEIPSAHLTDADFSRRVRLEKLAALSAWIGRDQGQDVSHLLSRGQDHFYTLSYEAPWVRDAYDRMAECWENAGIHAMARRLRRSIEFALDTEIATVKVESPSLSVVAPEWRSAPGFRALFLMNPRPHYGLDTLYDGLCACLGDENVVEYPWKPTLHGGDVASHRNYPCRFDRGGAPTTTEALAGALRDQAFDVILYGDVEGDLPLDDMRRLLAARGDCPVFLVDALDQLCNFRHLVRERLGIDEFQGYFKREMLGGLDYGPNTYPMPFSYTPPAQPPRWGENRVHDFFWAGHRMFGQRRLYLESLEKRFGWNLHATYSQAEYQTRLATSGMGLNCFGMGFDTVRYWELPAHGCLLLSERLPIRVPFDFESGRECVFFDDLADLVDKLDYYLARPDAVAAIAQAGYAHYARYHTNEARARQVLGWIRGLTE